ncbi:hypothetical protein [Sphaerisporangium sp. NPDC051011]|uniref:hypothetical protein n=1 Tax=Sphaerisporangium sp. NPDC051011 TaxID=3155792 RepID=UPI0033D104E7
MQPPHGVAIDDAEAPGWVRAYLSAQQLKLTRALQWILVLYRMGRAKALESSRIDVAQRLHIHMEGRERKEWDPSEASLAADLNLSVTTVGDSLDDLEASGWILVRRRHKRPSVYRLAWPQTDPLAEPKEESPKCGQPTRKGGICTRKPGRGTAHPGVGPCILHGGTPRLEPQPLEQAPAASAPAAGAVNPNRWSGEPQPLEQGPPAVGDTYVRSVRGSLDESFPPVLAVGELQDRNARASATAPTAQPVDFLARKILASTRRYAAAPRWVRRHLADLIGAALSAGFGAEAVTRYVRMVIDEHRYPEHQHIPEARAALGRLGRDVAQGDACLQHGIPECWCTDRPWTAKDQADFEAGLAYLGATLDDLAKEA